MTNTQPSGIDLARVALKAAREAAKNKPQPTQPRKRRVMARGNGRDPVTFGDAITNLVAERAWEVPAAGGSILDRWPTIAPELVGKVAAESFDAQRRILSLRPVSPAFGTQLRLLGQQLIARINTAMGGNVVQSLRILPPGAIGATQEPTPEPRQAPAVAAGEYVTREPSPAFHAAMAAVQAARKEVAADPERELRDRYFGAARGSLREPESAFADGQAFTQGLAEQQADDDDVHARALAAARAAKAGRPVPGVRRLADTA